MCIRDRVCSKPCEPGRQFPHVHGSSVSPAGPFAAVIHAGRCLLYTSDAADDLLCVDLGGRRIIKKKKTAEVVNNLLIPVMIIEMHGEPI